MAVGSAGSDLGYQHEPDGKTLFDASQEGRALFWHAPSFEEIAQREKEPAEAK